MHAAETRRSHRHRAGAFALRQRHCLDAFLLREYDAHTYHRHTAPNATKDFLKRPRSSGDGAADARRRKPTGAAPARRQPESQRPRHTTIGLLGMRFYAP